MYMVIEKKELDRYHLVMDALKYLPQLGNRRASLYDWCQEKLVEHKEYIKEFGDDLPEVKNWTWEDSMKNVSDEEII